MLISVYLQYRHLSNLIHKQRQMYYPKRMNFWENVEFLLDQKGILKKQLTLEVGITPSAFNKGKQRNSIPAADTALKIARYLGVSLESLLELEPINQQTLVFSNESLEIAKYYLKLSNREKKIISTLLREMTE